MVRKNKNNLELWW